jgi:hypothetical protein
MFSMKNLTIIEKFILKFPRQIGISYISIGTILIYFTIVVPYQQVTAGNPEIKISWVGAAFGEIFLILGIPYLIFGSRFAVVAQQISDEHNNKCKKTPIYYISSVIFAMIVIASYGFARAFFDANRYIIIR